MIVENKSPALASRRFPLTDDEAAAKVCELTIEGMEGLVGAIFFSLDQFNKAMTEAGWRLDAPVYGQSEGAITWIGKAYKRPNETTLCKIVINSYGSYIEICNCWMLNADDSPAPVQPRNMFKFS